MTFFTNISGNIVQNCVIDIKISKPKSPMNLSIKPPVATVRREMLGIIIVGILKISQFGADLIWRCYLNKVGGFNIFFICRLILANYIFYFPGNSSFTA